MRLPLLITALLAVACGCAAPRRPAASTFEAAADPFENPDLTYQFGNGSRATWTVDDRTVLTLAVADGRLILNGRDSGPYEDGTPVRFLSAEVVLVGAERRAIPPAP